MSAITHDHLRLLVIYLLLEEFQLAETEEFAVIEDKNFS